MLSGSGEQDEADDTTAGVFKAQLTRLKMNGLEIYRCCENLPRIAYAARSSCRFRSAQDLCYPTGLPCEMVSLAHSGRPYAPTL
jgi:hypothetical protein